MVESLTVFDDVFVPWNRVFACREPQLAGPIALAFVEYHRFTAVSYKLPLVDALVGTAALISDMNGVAHAAHVHDKLAQLIAYAETVRTLTEMAALRGRIAQRGIAVPDPLTTNLAKLTFATGYHRALELVQDCAGGLLVTAPGADDWLNPEIRPVLEKYFRAAGPAEERLAPTARDQRPHDARLRRLPERARRPRGGLDRSREAPDGAFLRRQPCDRLRAAARGHRHHRSLNPEGSVSSRRGVRARSRAGRWSRPIPAVLRRPRPPR